MSRIYQIIDTETRAKKKPRLVTILKQEVYKDVELHTYKHTEGVLMESKQQVNAVSADTTENLDGAIIARFVKFRDAQLRRLLTSVLADEEHPQADDVLDLDEVFAYRLNLSEGFKDSVLRSLAEYMHRFLVWGALYDWYAQMGMGQANVYKRELNEIENSINDIVRTPSIAKRPLQPFGPAHKFRNW